MKRAALLVAALLASLLVPLLAFAGPASAHCVPPDGQSNTVYKIYNKNFQYVPTNVHSDWVIFRRGGTINYSETRTMEVNASMSTSVSAEAGVIFGKVSASVDFSVGKSLSDSRQWSYTANVPADTHHKYRLHAYHWTVTFTVSKKQFSYADCDYHRSKGFPSRVFHAPAKASKNVWRLDKRDA